VEQRGVHTPRKQPQIGITRRRKARQQVMRGDEGAQGAVVNAAQPRRHHRLQPADAVVARVLVKVGMKAGRDGQAKLVRGRDGGGAEGSFGSHMHKVGPAGGPKLAQSARCGQAKAQLRIAWQRNARQPHLPASKPVRNAETR
jgi:hypothetical protein